MLAAARQKRGFGAPPAAGGGGHIALRCPAARKPGAHIHVRPLGAVRLALVPGQRGGRAQNVPAMLKGRRPEASGLPRNCRLSMSSGAASARAATRPSST